MAPDIFINTSIIIAAVIGMAYWTATRLAQTMHDNRQEILSRIGVRRYSFDGGGFNWEEKVRL